MYLVSREDVHLEMRVLIASAVADLIITWSPGKAFPSIINWAHSPILNSPQDMPLEHVFSQPYLFNFWPDLPSCSYVSTLHSILPPIPNSLLPKLFLGRFFSSM